jgi:glycine dehydrogenase subunit 1
MYDGATALAEAVLMADRVGRKGKVAVSRALFPHLRRVVSTYAWAVGIELVEVPCGADGRTDLSALSQGVSALVLQTPNAFGVIEDLSGVKERLGEALLVVSANPIACALLEPPGAFGADIVVGEGQPLGLSPSFGGPLLGLFASREAYLRQMPGRLVSRTLDAAGQTGYVLAAQTREQHIRREKATSNICTNAALCALSATVYMASLGAEGLRHLALLNWERAHDLAAKIATFPGYSLAFKAPFFNEVTVRMPGDAERTRLRLKEAGFLVGSSKPLAALGVPNALRFAVTEKRTPEEIDRLVLALGGAR